MKQISICIPTYNRTTLLYDSFKQVYSDDRIGEIIVVDDCSDMEIYDQLNSVFPHLEKVRLFRNDTNQDCYKNKRIAVSKAALPYVIIFDSDNELSVDYLNKIYKEEWQPNKILQPSFAKPTFDFRAYAGLEITQENVSQYIGKPMFDTALNAMNFFINKEEYLKVWDGSTDPVTADSIYFNYCWLKAGNKIKFVEGLEYNHRVHDGSHYKNNVTRTPSGFYESIINNLKQLK